MTKFTVVLTKTVQLILKNVVVLFSMKMHIEKKNDVLGIYVSLNLFQGGNKVARVRKRMRCDEGEKWCLPKYELGHYQEL